MNYQGRARELVLLCNESNRNLHESIIEQSLMQVERETLERLSDEVDGWWASRTPDWIRARIRNIAKDTIQVTQIDSGGVEGHAAARGGSNCHVNQPQAIGDKDEGSPKSGPDVMETMHGKREPTPGCSGVGEQEPVGIKSDPESTSSKVYLKNGMRVLGVECEKCGHETSVGDTTAWEGQLGKVTQTDYREMAEEIVKQIDDNYSEFCGDVTPGLDGHKEYSPFKAKEYFAFQVGLIQSLLQRVASKAPTDYELTDVWRLAHCDAIAREQKLIEELRALKAPATEQGDCLPGCQEHRTCRAPCRHEEDFKFLREQYEKLTQVLVDMEEVSTADATELTEWRRRWGSLEHVEKMRERLSQDPAVCGPTHCEIGAHGGDCSVVTRPGWRKDG